MHFAGGKEYVEKDSEIYTQVCILGLTNTCVVLKTWYFKGIALFWMHTMKVWN